MIAVLPSMDFETYSEAGYRFEPQHPHGVVNGKWVPPYKVKGVGSQGKGGLPVVGTPAYAEHPSTEILSLVYDLKDGRGRRMWLPGLPDPVELLDHVRRGGIIKAWNFTFEWYIWNFVAVRRYGWPPLQIEQGRCDMAEARRFSLPGSLQKASEVLGLPGKDKAGENLIRKLCVPKTPTKGRSEHRWTPATAWEDFRALYAYNDQDVKAEDEASARIPDLTPYELDTWILDQRINARGVLVDTATLDAALNIFEQARDKYHAELSYLTGGAVSSVSQNARFIKWVQSRGVVTSSLDADHREALLKTDLPGDVRRALEIANLVMSANVKKLYTIKLQLSSDGRLRDQYSYCGAAQTGRASSGGAQLQNITSKGPETSYCEGCGQYFGTKAETSEGCPRCRCIFGIRKEPEWTIDAALQAILDLHSGSLEHVERVWGSPVDVICGILRPLFMAAPGKKFVCVDFSAIEAVGAACLSGCEWRIEVFQTHGKIYEMSAAKITGKTLEHYLDYKKEHGQHHEDRKKIGKIAELACFGPDTQVLTRRGYVRIVEVTNRDYLWDGMRWVQSEGVVRKGVKKVIGLDGVLVTPGHPVSLGDSWREAKLLASHPSILLRALEIGSGSLPWSDLSSDPRSGGLWCPVRAEGATTSFRCLTYTLKSLLGALGAGVNRAAARILRSTASTHISCRTPKTAGVSSIGCGRLSPGVTPPPTVSTQTTAAGGYPYARSGGGRTALPLSCSTLSPLGGGTPLNSRWTVSTLTEITNLATSALYRVGKTCLINALSRRCRRESMNLSDVYDIVNAGPLHRFTIKTDSGHLIVHNSGYQGWVGAWKAFGADEYFDDNTIKELILKWRADSPEIVDMWGGQYKWCGPGKWDFRRELYGLEGMAISAVLSPGQEFSYRGITYVVKDDVLYCRLLSGRYLHYHRPRLADVQDKRRLGPAVSLSFEGYNSNPQKGPIGWIRQETWGGKLFENCLARGTLVLTPRGWVPIESVHSDDLVHDGVEWVRHGGVVFKSEQRCVTIDGVLMTPEHEVLTDDGWKEARTQPKPLRPVLRDTHGGGGALKRREEKEVPLRVRVWRYLRENRIRRHQRGEARRDSELRVHYQEAAEGATHLPRYEPTPCLRRLPFYVRQVPTALSSSLEKLWRAGYHSMQGVADVIRELLVRHGGVVPPGSPAGPERQQPGVLSGELSVGAGKNKRQQQTVESCHTDPSRSYDGVRGVGSVWNRKHYNPVPGRLRLAGGEVVRQAGLSEPVPVFDIVSAGPRRRFVVLGDDGPFIVHNCDQAVCADLQFEALLRCERAGYHIVMHTHDEGTAEVPDDPSYSVEEMCRIMSIRPAWAQDWPIKAAGWEHKRYQKD